MGGWGGLGHLRGTVTFTWGRTGPHSLMGRKAGWVRPPWLREMWTVGWTRARWSPRGPRHRSHLCGEVGQPEHPCVSAPGAAPGAGEGRGGRWETPGWRGASHSGHPSPSWLCGQGGWGYLMWLRTAPLFQPSPPKRQRDAGWQQNGAPDGGTVPSSLGRPAHAPCSTLLGAPGWGRDPVVPVLAAGCSTLHGHPLHPGGGTGATLRPSANRGRGWLAWPRGW